jgi:hypothetical protein
MHVTDKMSLTCKTIQTVPPSHECMRKFSKGDALMFLAKNFPMKEAEASPWLNAIVEDENGLSRRQVDPLETIFVVRHGGQNFRAYLDGRSLQFLRSRPGTTHLRPQQNPNDPLKKNLELVIVTESGLVLQKNVTWPPVRKFIVTRLPPSSKISDLSQLSSGK